MVQNVPAFVRLIREMQPWYHTVSASHSRLKPSKTRVRYVTSGTQNGTKSACNHVRFQPVTPSHRAKTRGTTAVPGCAQPVGTRVHTAVPNPVTPSHRAKPQHCGARKCIQNPRATMSEMVPHGHTSVTFVAGQADRGESPGPQW